MDPFKITCVTCRAVLTVRKESMIGQIIACPRCSMMVQIAAPAGYTPTVAPAPVSAAPTAPPVAPPTVATPALPQAPAPPAPTSKPKAAAVVVTAAATFDAHDILAEAAAPTAPVEAAPHVAATFDDAADSYTDAPHAAAQTAPTVSTPLAGAGIPPATSATATAVTSRWATFKFPVMVIGGALAGASLVGATLWLLSGDDAPPAVAAAGSAPSPAANIAPEVAPVPATPPAVSPELPAVESPSDQPATAAADSNAAGPPAPPVDSIADDPFADVPAATEAAGNAVPAATDDAASDQPAEKEGGAQPGDAEQVADGDEAKPPVADAPPKLRIDPLDIDPEGLNLSTLYNGPPKDPIALSDLPDEQPAPVSVPAHEAERNDAAPPAAGPAPVGPVRRDSQPGLAAPANVATLLARRVPSLKVEALSLCRLLDDAVQWGGVPISVAPDQLRLAAVSAGQPATATVTDATLEEFLTTALKPLRLKPVVVDEQIMLIRIADDQVRSVDYAVDDLAREPARVEELAANIQKLIAPESWQAAGGAGTLTIDGSKLKVKQRESVQYEILLLLERSRAALKLPARSKYPAALIAADAPAVALAARLGGPTTFTFSQYTPLREIFRHWQEELGVAVLVDWPALADLRLWPNTKIACSSSGTPWHAALDSVLEPLGLAWRPIDGRTIEITTLEKAASAPLVEVYRLNPDALAAIDNLVGELDQVAAAVGPHANAGEMATILNGEHSLLLVRQSALVQREFAEWLAAKGLLQAN